MNHNWPPKSDWIRTPGWETSDGNERIARSCARCGMQKVTVISGSLYAKHEWVTHQGKRWEGTATPPCIEQQVEEVRAI